MNKIKITEQQLHWIIKESVNKVLNEYGSSPNGQVDLAALNYKKNKKKMGRELTDIDHYADKQGNMTYFPDENHRAYNAAYQYLTTNPNLDNPETKKKLNAIADFYNNEIEQDKMRRENYKA